MAENDPQKWRTTMFQMQIVSQVKLTIAIHLLPSKLIAIFMLLEPYGVPSPPYIESKWNLPWWEAKPRTVWWKKSHWQIAVQKELRD